MQETMGITIDSGETGMKKEKVWKNFNICHYKILIGKTRKIIFKTLHFDKLQKKIQFIHLTFQVGSYVKQTWDSLMGEKMKKNKKFYFEHTR